MAKFESAGFPLFGLSTGGGKNGEYMALCGGGGSSKTGIKNGVILLRWKGEGKVEEVATVNLSGMAPTSLAIGKGCSLFYYYFSFYFFFYTIFFSLFFSFLFLFSLFSPLPFLPLIPPIPSKR